MTSVPPDPDLVRDRTTAFVATGLASLPVVVAAGRASTGRWVPQGDDAYFTLRSLDVATEHHPLLGAWSSGSADIERDVNNLGPLQLDLLAPFTKVVPMAGTAIGVAVVQVAAIVTIAWLIRRVAGYRAVLPVMAAVALMTWVMGSEMLITPRQHQYLLLPYLCVLVAAWAAAAGDRWAIVPFVAAGSLVTQTHLSYPILVAAVAVPAVGGQIIAFVQSDDPRAHGRPWAVAAALAAVLWSQTLIDQWFGWGNLRAVLASPGETEAAGFATGLRIVADVLIAPRGYLRPGFADYDPNGSIAGDARLSAFVVVWIVLGGAAVVAWRTSHRTAGAGLAVAAAAIAASVVDAAQLPVTQFGLTAANYRWLWPTGAFLVIGGLLAVQRYVRVRDPRHAAVAFAVPLVAIVGLNLPTSYQVDQPEVYRDRIVATTDLTEQLEAADLGRIDGPVVIDQSRMYFGHPFAYPVAVVLRDRGFEYRLEGTQQRRRFGESRVADGTEPYRLVLLHGDDARVRDGGADVIAYIGGPDPVAVILEELG